MGSNSYCVYNYSATASLVNNDTWGVDVDCLIYVDYHPGGACGASTIEDLNDCTWTGCQEASGNINENPLFVDPDNGDFHLQSGSPCRDVGIDPVPDYIESGFVDFDFDGDERPQGAGWDIGADEYTVIP